MITKKLNDFLTEEELLYSGQAELTIVQGHSNDSSAVFDLFRDVSAMLSPIDLFNVQWDIGLAKDNHNFVTIMYFAIGQLLSCAKNVVVFIPMDSNEAKGMDVEVFIERLESIAANYKARVVRVQ